MPEGIRGLLLVRTQVPPVSRQLDLVRAEAQLRSLAATVPLAESDLVRQEQRLAVLTAWPVETLRSKVSSATTIPELPALVATGTPADWLRRRPDIRSAERDACAILAQKNTAAQMAVVALFEPARCETTTSPAKALTSR